MERLREEMLHRDSYAQRVLKTTAQATFSECVTIRQLEPEAVDLLHGYFGGYRGVAVERRRVRQPLQVLQLVDRRAAALLYLVAPYLRIKRQQAELCLELRGLKEESRAVRFAHGRGHRGGGNRPERITASMEGLYARVATLNQRARHAYGSRADRLNADTGERAG